MGSWHHVQQNWKFRTHSFPDKTSPVPSPPWPLALIPVSLAQTFTLACPAAPWYHHDIISPCPKVKSPKPTSTIFPNSVYGDPVLPLPHVSDTTVLLFSYIPLPSGQQVLQTPPSKCVWSLTLLLHSCCSHSGGSIIYPIDYSSCLLTCIHPHPFPLTACFP